MIDLSEIVRATYEFPRVTIKEFRMSPATLEELKRYFAFVAPSGSKIADFMLFGVPIVLDPRVPDETALPIPVEEQPFIWDDSNRGEGRADYLLQRYQPLSWPRPRITDEAPGITLAELLGEIDQVLEQG